VVLSFGGRLELDVFAGDRVPPATDLLVVAQDVNLILGDVGTLEDTGETAQELLALERSGQSAQLGSILVAPAQQGAPLALHAVVYDFAARPPVESRVVFETLVVCFEEARKRRLARLALAPVGTAHHGIEAGEFLALLTQVCYSAVELGTSLRQVHLLVRSAQEVAAYEALIRGIGAPRRAAGRAGA
jgi:hypothetical protein